MSVQRLLRFDLAGWRMAGPGGFRFLPDGAVESYGGSGLFWYRDEVFQDFVLSMQLRISRPEDNSDGVNDLALDRLARHWIRRHGNVFALGDGHGKFACVVGMVVRRL
jgi:hypothetical protein